MNFFLIRMLRSESQSFLILSPGFISTGTRHQLLGKRRDGKGKLPPCIDSTNEDMRSVKPHKTDREGSITITKQKVPPMESGYGRKGTTVDLDSSYLN